MAFPYDDDLMNLADEELAAEQAGRRALETQAAANQLESDTANLPATPPRRDYAALMDEYRALQQSRQASQADLGYLAAAQTIGQAFAGQHSGNFKADDSNIQMLQKMADQPVTDFQDQMKQQDVLNQLQAVDRKNDPNSPLAKTLAEYTKLKGIKTQPGLAADETAAVLKTIDPAQDQLTAQKIAVGELAATDSKEARDPNSNISRAYQAAAIKLGLPAEMVQGKSAHDLEKILKVYREQREKSESFIPQSVYDPVTGETRIGAFSTKTGQLTQVPGAIKGFAPKTDLDPRTGEKNIFAPGLGKSVGPAYGGPAAAPTPEQPAKLDRGMLDVEQGKRVDDARKALLDDTKEERKAVEDADAIVSLLGAGKALDGDILRAVQTKFARASGEKGAMTEQDVAPYGGRQAVLDRIQRSLNMWTTGKITDDDRAFLAGLADTMKKRSQANVQSRSEFFVNNMTNDLKSSKALQGSNFGAPQVAELLGVNTLMQERGDLQSQSVRVRDIKTGKTGTIPADKAEAAIASGKYELVK